MLKAKIINYVVAKAKRNKFLISLIEKPIDLKKLSVKGTFKASDGTVFTLYNQLRSKIKPGWQGYFNTVPTQLPSDKKTVANILERSQLEVARIETLIETFAGGIAGKTIVEIGCHSGGVAYTFADKGASKVIGTDYVEYKVSSSDANEKHVANNDIVSSLTTLRKAVGAGCRNPQNVMFQNDDICHTQLPRNYFDIACSWDVLEHIHEPSTAFESLFTILKPGGIAIHEYNPFFGLNGGHSPCTIDFPWGHAALSPTDFERYCNELQPDKKEKALSFYYNGLNRMTLFDMKEYGKKAGLELKAYLPFTKEQHVYLMNEQTLRQVLKNYPTSTISDLLTPRVLVVFKKPN
jgi:2-polyprenyl-3-methyl-5-hydroxy-6-metoxy-1,4-benzoquinol methylase